MAVNENPDRKKKKSKKKSGFIQGDSGLYQLLSITYKIYNSFDEGFEVCGVLDVSHYPIIKHIHI